MKIANVLFSILGLSVSTIVTVWLVGSLVAWVVDEAGSVGEDVLAELSAPWFGAYAQIPVRNIDKAPAPGKSNASSINAAHRPAR